MKMFFLISFFQTVAKFLHYCSTKRAHFFYRFQFLNRLERYFIAEFFKTHSITLLIIYIILLINNFLLMMPYLLPLKIRSLDIINLIISITPSTIFWSLPFSSLLGTLLLVGRLVFNNEIIAAASLGISLKYILRPFLIYGLFIILVSYTLDVFISPPAYKLFNKMNKNIMMLAPQLVINSNISILFNNTLLVTGPRSQDGTLENVIIIEKDVKDNDNMHNKITFAQKGMLYRTKKNNEPILNLTNIQSVIAPKNTYLTDYQLFSARKALYRFDITPEKISSSTTLSSLTFTTTLKNFIKTRKEQSIVRKNSKQTVKQWQHLLFDNYLDHYQNNTQSTEKELIISFDNFNYHRKPRRFHFMSAVHGIELYQKLSLMISSLIFIFFALVFSVSRKNIHQTIILAIGSFLCVCYWFSFHFLISLIISYKTSTLVIISSDLAFLLASFFMLKRNKL